MHPSGRYMDAAPKVPATDQRKRYMEARVGTLRFLFEAHAGARDGRSDGRVWLYAHRSRPCAAEHLRVLRAQNRF
jgi:hypothetical protein